MIGLRLKLFIAVFFVALQVFGAEGDDLSFHKVTTSQGLSHNTVYSIVQDKKDFMWFGTREGLNRFDGEEIISFYNNAEDSQSLVSNHISSLAVDDEGLLYVGTSSGLSTYDYEQEKFFQIKFEGNNIGYVNKLFTSEDGSVFICTNSGLYIKKKGDSEIVLLMGQANVLDLIEFKKGVFWISTLQKIILINSYGEIIKQYDAIANGTDKAINLSYNISCLFKDSFGEIWVGTKKNGLLKYDETQDWFKPLFAGRNYNSPEANIIRAISEDHRHNLWVGTESGLFIYNREQNNFKHYFQSFEKLSSSLNDKAIYTIYRGREGIMWLGTYFGGVNMARPSEKGFNVLLPDGGEKALSGKAISQIMEDRNSNIWVATEDGGVNIWNRDNDTFEYLRNTPEKNSLSVDNVHALFEDDDGTIWIGTFLGGLNKYDPKTNKITVFQNYSKESSAFNNNMVYAIHRDSNGTLWIGTQAGLNVFDSAREGYVPFKPEVFNGKFVYDIYEDNAGGLWFCVMNSDVIYYYQPQKGLIKEYHYSQSSPSATNQGTIAALQDSRGSMWFGTVDSGLITLDTINNTFRSYTVRDGLPNNYVYGILEDDHQNLWVSTNKGLSKFEMDNGKFSNFDISHGLPNNQFNFKSAFKDGSGWMFFGTINGLCYFHPDSLILNEIPPKVYFLDFKLFNNSISVSKGSLLQSNIDEVKSVTLKHKENVITFEYSSISYFTLGNNKYAYYLEGFENDWNYVDKKKSATYTNLSPGNYVFKLKAANNDGMWSDIREIKVRILPPFWLTTWAFLIYLLLIVGLILLYRSFLNHRNKQKMAFQIERLEREKIMEINQHKINFFTYISHEFKTPLTLIIASIDKLLMDKNGGFEHNQIYRSIKKNAQRLHFLIEQLMEFRKMETNHSQINYNRGDIVLFLFDTFNAFIPLFNKKELDFHFNSDSASFNTYFDGDKLEKIVANLISNATKYTPDEGFVEMDLKIVTSDADDEYDKIEICISDSGHGIDQKELDKVFTTFYQTEQGQVVPTGTGVGLSLVKSLVEFLNGAIKIDSSLYNGTVIVVTLPLKKQLENKNVKLIEGNKKLDIEHELIEESVDELEEPVIAGHHRVFKLMIVEDNKEIMQFLGNHFQQNYKIVKASNGKVALDRIAKDVPDVIISDIMMPEMDGLEFCRKVKSDIKTSHIPVILLTAKTTIENKLEGLDVGADIYLSKPFNLREIELRVKNLLESRNNFRNHFLKFGSVKDIDIPINNKDQDFLEYLTKIVEKNIDNPDFNISFFTREAGISRTLLHMKLKKLVNLSASEFVKTIRLKHAAELLKKTELTIAEVAYSVGYADSNYFSRTFKEKYNVNPSEYKQLSH